MTSLPEIIVDSFAGGGGASEGIERAMRRMQRLGLLPAGVEPIVNIAINHDSKALAMHAANHPRSLHLPCDIWTADPRGTVGRNPVGLLWASPDCRHHSKAKGGAPVSDSVRSLAWVIAHWAEQVRPRMIFLENVEEFAEWGPLVADEKGEMRADKTRKGETFKQWVRRFKRLGYEVDTCVARACVVGAPTIRKRLYVMMRCDGAPIVWPWATHGAPDSPEVASGVLKPYRTAAEIIDWDLPCPSILMDAAEGKAYTAKTGTRIIRPLADNTERRVAKGIKRYVLDAAKPFIVTSSGVDVCNGAHIVTCNHGGDGFRGQGLDAPFATVTKARDGHGLVVPHMMTMRNSGKPYTAAHEPVHTVTAGGAGLSLVNAALAPCMVAVNHGDSGGRRAFPFSEPFNTVTREQSRAVVAAHLIQHSAGSHPGQPGRDAAEPLSTITGRGTQQGIVTAHMMSLKGSTRRAYGTDEPHQTVTAGGQHSGVVAANLIRHFGASVGSGMDDAVGTITAGGGGKTGLVSMPLLNAYYGCDDHGADIAQPCRTISTRDRFGLVDCPATLPPMTAAQAESARKVAAFLRKYDCWDGGEFVTVGAYIIVDIGMRMLTPRELARAQGFGDDYVLAAPWLNPKTGKFQPLTETDQRHKIGNSVCPDVAEALVFANYRPQMNTAPVPQQNWMLGNGWDVTHLEAAE